VKILKVAQFGESPLSPWREPKGSIRLGVDRKAAIFLIAGEILIYSLSIFILMGAPRLDSDGA
jgi:hypothetical protein